MEVPMTNLKHIQSMSLEDFAEWLDEHGQFDDSPWMHWFAQKYCDKCESIKCRYQDVEQLLGFDAMSSEREVECAYCEVYGKCKYFEEIDDIPNNLEIIKMWLNKEAD
jgi:hypothetical protein